MKKHLSILFVIFLLFALPASAFAALSQDGDVYLISTSEDLGEFRAMVNDGSTDISAKLTADIDLAMKSWTPIGWSAISGDTITDYSYSGTFDGNGYAVLNLTVPSANLAPVEGGLNKDRSAGLFGVLSGDACVQNLTVEGVEMDLSEYDEHPVYAGAVAGISHGAIQNCAVIDASIIGGTSVGSVVGSNGSGTIQNCTVYSADISAKSNAGGVAGGSFGPIANVQNCAVFGVTVSAVNMDSEARSGALAGAGNVGAIQNCVAMDGEKQSSVSASAVAADDAYAGGALGARFGPGTITNTRYPVGIVVTGNIHSGQNEWAIGNVKPASMDNNTNVASYDAAQQPENLSFVTAIIEQGISVTITRGASYELDVTTLPGTSGDVTCAWSIQGEDTGILTIDELETDLTVLVTGLELGEAFVQCAVRGEISVDLTCSVKVVEATGNSSSNCNSGVGAAFFALAGLFFVGKRKR